ncbi:MAG: hypothetical protein AAF961_06330, partial [Planctomycetota bacterium]
AILDKARSHAALSRRAARMLLAAATALALAIGTVGWDSQDVPQAAGSEGSEARTSAQAPEDSASDSTEPILEKVEKERSALNLLTSAADAAAVHQQAIHSAHLRFWLTRMGGPFKSDATPQRCGELLAKYDLVQRPHELRSLMADLLDSEAIPAERVYATPWSEMELHFARHESRGTRIRQTRHSRAGEPDLHIIDGDVSLRWDEVNSQLNIAQRHDNRYGYARPADFWRPLSDPQPLLNTGVDVKRIGDMLVLAGSKRGAFMATVDAATGFYMSTDRASLDRRQQQRWLSWTTSHEGIAYPRVVTHLGFSGDALSFVEISIVREARFNMPLSDSLFRLGAPAGSVVVDRRTDPTRSRRIHRDVFDASSVSEVGNATRPVEEAFTQTERDAFAALRQLYVLEDDEVLTRFGPPYPLARKYLARMLSPGTVPLRRTRSPQCNLLAWRNGEISPSSKFGMSPRVSHLISALIEHPSTDLDIPRSLLELDVPGDFLYRPEASPESKADALSAILSHELGRPIRLSFEDVERTIYVARGELQIDLSKVRRYEQLPCIAVNGGDHDGDYGEILGRGELPRLLEDVADYVGARIVDETTPAQQELAWSERWYDLRTTPKDERFLLKPKVVLGQIEEQTGIRFHEEHQVVRVLKLAGS